MLIYIVVQCIFLHIFNILISFLLLLLLWATDPVSPQGANKVFWFCKKKNDFFYL